MHKNNKDILIIDRDTITGKKYQLMFQQLGFAADTCSGLSIAVQKMKASRFNCIIMDVDLPEMKGCNAIRLVKMLDSKANIIITASENTKELEARVREHNIFYYYIKSFGINELKQAVCNAIKINIV
ncbi:MAG: response regulator [bacterium]